MKKIRNEIKEIVRKNKILTTLFTSFVIFSGINFYLIFKFTRLLTKI